MRLKPYNTLEKKVPGKSNKQICAGTNLETLGNMKIYWECNELVDRIGEGDVEI